MGVKKDLRALHEDYIDGLRKVTEEKLQQGALIETVLSEDEGLVFKDGRREKPKKIIIINIDREKRVCYGALLINTRMNPKSGYSDEYMAAQYLLQEEKYPEFLKYDSYVDCSVIFSIPIEKLLRGKYFEKLKSEDLAGVLDLLETSEILTTKIKKRFNIKRR